MTYFSGQLWENDNHTLYAAMTNTEKEASRKQYGEHPCYKGNVFLTGKHVFSKESNTRLHHRYKTLIIGIGNGVTRKI